MIVLERAPLGSLHDFLHQLKNPAVLPLVFQLMAQCVQQIHSKHARFHCFLLAFSRAVFDSQLVWGDLKLEHFLVFSGLPLIVKAVDFDAAVSFGERLTDAFSPRYAPPERAKLISQQRKGAAAAAATLIAHPSYDSELVCCDRFDC